MTFQLRDKIYAPVWGNQSVATTTAIRFMEPGFDNTGLAPLTTCEFRSPPFVTIWKDLQAHARIAGVGAPTLSFTLIVNGVATVLVATGAAALSDWSDLVNRVVVPASALIGIRVTKSAAIGTSPTDILATVSVAP